MPASFIYDTVVVELVLLFCSGYHYCLFWEWSCCSCPIIVPVESCKWFCLLVSWVLSVIKFPNFWWVLVVRPVVKESKISFPVAIPSCLPNIPFGNTACIPAARDVFGVLESYMFGSLVRRSFVKCVSPPPWCVPIWRKYGLSAPLPQPPPRPPFPVTATLSTLGVYCLASCGTWVPREFLLACICNTSSLNLLHACIAV